MKTTSDGNGSVPRHLEAAELISFLDGELERGEQEQARAHLEGCWNCRSRLLAVENSIETFLRARKQILPDDIPPASAATAQFRRRLAQHRNAPVGARLQITRWLSLRRLFSAPKVLTPVFSYRKTALASAAIAIAVLVVAFFDPFKWSAVSADELLSRASAHELLNESPKGKVVRARARLDRINRATKTETNLGQIETDADNLSPALFVSVFSASGVTHRETLSDRDKPAANFFGYAFPPETASYLRDQGWVPQVSVDVYQRLIAGRSLHGNEGASVTRRGVAYEVHHSFAAGHQSHISEAVITLDSQSYAPRTMSILTVEGSEQFEYRLTRTSIESVERTPEMAKLFESPAESVTTKLETRNSKPETEDPKPETPNSKLETAASLDLEVEVLRLLNQAGADLGEQISVSRTSGGPVIVNGLVETEQRKNEVLRGLQPVAGNPAVRIDVKTVAEAVAERRDKRETARAATVEGVEVAADTFPAYQDLRARMSDEDARVFAARMVSRSHSAMRHAWALKRLMSQFSLKDLTALQPEAHAKWITLVKSHARAFENESRSLREQLQPIFGSGSAGVSPAAGPVTDDASLIRAVERLVALASTNYEVVRSAFTVTSASSQFSAIRSPQFWNSMRNAEAVAASIGSQNRER